MIVVPMGKSDLSDVLALYEQLIGTKEELSKAEKQWNEIKKDERCKILVAKDDHGKVLGTAMCILCPSLTENGRPFLVVENVIVSDECQGKGVGTLLFHAVDQFALHHQCSYSILVSSAHRTKAHQFYEKAGYCDSVKGFRKVYNFK